MKAFSRFQSRQRWASARTAGFTALELIGVLSIVVLLVSLVAESVIRRVKDSARRAEVANLRAMAGSLKTGVARARSLPALTNALGLIGEELALGPTLVSVNSQGQGRVVLYDPNLGFGGGTSTPYTQGVRGARETLSLRVILMSSLTDPLPSLTASTNFAFLWNTPTESVPAAWGAAWAGEAGDLVVERVDLQSLFCRLHLNNLDRTLPGRYGVLATNTVTTLAALSTTNGWYFIGTPLLLFDSSGSLQVTEVLSEDASYVFENGRWGRYLVSGITKTPGIFGELVDEFLLAVPPPEDANQFGANQQAIVDEMYYFMWSYSNWASAGFFKGGSSSSQHVPELRFIEDSSVRLNQVSNNLLKN